MAVQIGSFKPSGGLMGSKAFKVAQGYASGGPGGGALALAGANNPALGQAAGIAGVGRSSPLLPSTQSLTPNPMGEVSTPPQAPAQPVGPTSALEKRYAALSQDPQSVIAGGLAALRDPSVPQELRDAYAEPLLRAKYGRIG